MKDIEFKSSTQKFKYRVNGVIINNNKLLTLKMKNNISYCLPGGHVELGEDSKSAILREMLEEIGTPVSIVKELAIVENFYLDKNNFQTHEISFYYVVNPDNFEWLDISMLEDYDFRPEFLKEKLIDKNYNFEHIIKK